MCLMQEPSSRLSVGAIIGLVTALIPLCPPVNFVGVVVGLSAMRAIRRSQGRLRGHGLAKAAVICGLLMGSVSWYLWSEAADWLNDEIQTTSTATVNTFFNATMADDQLTLANQWDLVWLPDMDKVAELRSALEHAGGFKTAHLRNLEPVSGVDRVMEAWLVVHTADAVYNGGVRLQVDLQGVGIPRVDVELQRLRLDLPSGEVVVGAFDGEMALLKGDVRSESRELFEKSEDKKQVLQPLEGND